MGNLTPKQEKFCLAYIETSNASEAYRRCYNVGENTKDETVWRKAKELLDNGKVAARIKELQAVHVKAHECTIESLIAELEEARQLGLSTAQVGATVSAVMGKAKIMGFDRQIIDHQTKGEPIRFSWLPADD